MGFCRGVKPDSLLPTRHLQWAKCTPTLVLMVLPCSSHEVSKEGSPSPNVGRGQSPREGQ